MSHPHGESAEPATQPVSAPSPLSEAAYTPAPPAAAAEPVSAAQPAAYQPAPAPPAPPAPAYTPAAAQAHPQAAAPVSEPTLVAAGAPAAGGDAAAYQIGVAPVSAPAYAPVSAMPGYGQVSAVPYGLPGYPMEAPKKKSRAGLIVLSVLTGVLTLAAAAMTTLYFVEKSERTAADKLATERAAVITSDEAKIKDLEGKWAASKSEVAKLTQEVEGARSKTADVTKEKEAMANCFRAMDDYFASQSNATRQALVTACDEAAKYY